MATLATALACTALVPLNLYSNFTRLFDPTVYFTSQGGPLTSNAGALMMTGAIVLLGILVVFRQQAWGRSKLGAIATVLLVAGLGPFAVGQGSTDQTRVVFMVAPSGKAGGRLRTKEAVGNVRCSRPRSPLLQSE